MGLADRLHRRRRLVVGRLHDFLHLITHSTAAYRATCGQAGKVEPASAFIFLAAARDPRHSSNRCTTT